MKKLLLASCLLLAPVIAHANDGRDWWVIDQRTFTCVNLSTAGYPFKSPREFLVWAHNQNDLTFVTKEPNDPMGLWINIKVTPKTEDSNSGAIADSSIDFFQPAGNCQATLAYEQEKGMIPNSNDLQ